MRRPAESFLRHWLLICLLLPALAVADEFRVSELSAQREGDFFTMRAEVIYDFPKRPLEALQNGVPLTLEVHVQLRRKGAWIWEKDLLDIRLRYQIRYHALASIYQVIDMQSGSQEDFVTLESALAALGEIPEFPLINAERLETGQRYLLSLEVKLDIEALPLPLRSMAYITPSWNLSSEKKKWLLEP